MGPGVKCGAHLALGWGVVGYLDWEPDGRSSHPSSALTDSVTREKGHSSPCASIS